MGDRLGSHEPADDGGGLGRALLGAGSAIRSLTTLPNPSLKPSPYGQPHPATHPHLLKPTQLTPHFPASEYEERRRKLMERLPEGAVVVVMGGTVRLMTQREHHRPGRQGKQS